MVRSKILASAVGLASLAVVGVASAQPTELSVAQMDSVTAAGRVNGYNGNGKKYGFLKQTNLVLQSNYFSIEDSYVKGPVINVQINVIGNLTQINSVD